MPGCMQGPSNNAGGYLLRCRSSTMAPASPALRRLASARPALGTRHILIRIRVNRRLWRRDSKRLCRSGVRPLGPEKEAAERREIIAGGERQRTPGLRQVSKKP
jgi:hypothetical protein